MCVQPGTPLEVHFWRCSGSTKVSSLLILVSSSVDFNPVSFENHQKKTINHTHAYYLEC